MLILDEHVANALITAVGEMPTATPDDNTAELVHNTLALELFKMYLTSDSGDFRTAIKYFACKQNWLVWVLFRFSKEVFQELADKTGKPYEDVMNIFNVFRKDVVDLQQRKSAQETGIQEEEMLKQNECVKQRYAEQHQNSESVISA